MIKLVLGTVCLVVITAYGETKTESQVFNKWRAWQEIYADCILLAKPGSLASKIDKDTGDFFKQLEKKSFCSNAKNIRESGMPVEPVIDSYNTFVRHLLVPLSLKHALEQIMFAAANRFFESCYDYDFKQYKKYLYHTKKHQLVRLAQSVIWQQLVGFGWRNWHQAALDQMVQAAQRKQEIAYIAGGNDLLQPLRVLLGANTPHFVIRSIDPMLDTQEAFYADDYGWLLEGGGKNHGIGDRVRLKVNGKKYYLVRSEYSQDGTFKAQLANGIKQELPLSTTAWQVVDARGNERGQVIFERRFCNQADFNKSNSPLLVLSFNEMYHVALEPASGGWGIDIDALPANTSIVVKQLRRPVSKQVLKNLRAAEKAPCYFMFLGSCSN